MRATEFINEEKLGVEPKRAARPNARPDRGHTAEPRYKTKDETNEEAQIDERGPASVKLCKSSRSNADIGKSATDS